MKRRIRGDALKARDALWLHKRESGENAEAIAADAGVSKRFVNRRLALAREQALDAAAEPPDGREKTPAWLVLVPLFPIGPFTPASECPHRGPIAEGSLLCCMVCSASGMDGHPALARDPRFDPRPAARRAPSPTTAVASPAAGETRRERRRKLNELRDVLRESRA